MKLLLDVEAIRKRLSLMDHPDVISALESVLSSAQTFFEEALDTKFWKISGVDYFNLDTTVNPYSPDDFFRMRLKRSNIRSTPPVVIVGASSYRDLLGNINTYTLDESAGEFYVDSVKGIAYINKDVLKDYSGTSVEPRFDQWGNLSTINPNGYYSVAYDSGFISGSEIPDWLKEAFISYVPFLINQQQTYNKVDQQTPAFEEGKKTALKLIEPYMRDVGMCFRSIRSVIL